MFIFFLINTWIICAWDIWWYGGAFGQRAFIQSYVLLAFPLAAFLSWAQETGSKTVKYFTALFMTACMALNIFQTYQAHWGPFETDAMTKAYYWRIFGKTKNDPYDRLLLDAKEGYFGNKKNIVLLKKEDFENIPDTISLSDKHSVSGRWSSYVNVDREFSPAINIPPTENMHPGKWLHVSAAFYSPKMNWDYWTMPQLVVRFEKNEIPVKERIIRPFRVMVPNQWADAWMDIRIPREEFDNIEIFLWNAGRLDVELYMDNLTIEVYDNEG